MCYYPTFCLRLLSCLEVGDLVGFLGGVCVADRTYSLLIFDVLVDFIEVLL